MSLTHRNLYLQNLKSHQGQGMISVRNAISKKDAAGFKTDGDPPELEGSTGHNPSVRSSEKRFSISYPVVTGRDQRQSKGNAYEVTIAGLKSNAKPQELAVESSPKQFASGPSRHNRRNHGIVDSIQDTIDESNQPIDDARCYEPYPVPPSEHHREGYRFHPDSHLFQHFDVPEYHTRPAPVVTSIIYRSSPQRFGFYDSRNNHTHQYASPSPAAIISKSRDDEILHDEQIAVKPDQESNRCDIHPRRVEHSEPETLEDGEFINNPFPHAPLSQNDNFYRTLQEKHRQKTGQHDKDRQARKASVLDVRSSSTCLNSSGASPDSRGYSSVAQMKEAVHNMSRIKLCPRRSTYRQVRLASASSGPCGPSRNQKGEGPEYKSSRGAITIPDIKLTSETWQAGPTSSHFKPLQSRNEEINQGILYREVERTLDNMTSSLSELKRVANGESNLYRSPIEQVQNIWSQNKNYSLVLAEGSRTKASIPLEVQRHICEAICSGIPASAGFDIDIGAPAMVLHVDVNTALLKRS